MSEIEYLERDPPKEEEKTWCRLSKEGVLEYVDWTFVEQQATQFDVVGEAGARDNIMTMCKLMVAVRKQTLEKTAQLVSRFAGYNNDAAAVVLYDPTKTQLPPLTTFVFFHVGDDLSQPSRLVDSIQKTNVGAEIVMCTDSATPQLEGVKRFEFEVDRERLMTSRWKAYKELNLDRPAVYLDTDMVVRGFINMPAILGDKRFAFCNRTFDRALPISDNMRGIEFSEHGGRPLGVVYPILACFVATRSGAEWSELYERCAALPDKYHKWYGDQVALRETVNEIKGQDFNLVEESMFGCLPEYADKHSPFIVHYKGGRKNATA